jgi:hypothetical protein
MYWSPMTTFLSLRSFRLLWIATFFVAALFIAVAPARAADGSGTLGLTEDSATYAIVHDRGNELKITYTADESLQDGTFNLMVPSGWSAPTSTYFKNGYTVVSMSTGTIASVVDSLDSATGWTDNSIFISESADTSVKKEGSASLNVNVTAALGVERVYRSLGGSVDWSEKTKVGMWVRPSTAITLGTLSFVISETSNMSSVAEQYAMPALPANVWTYVTFGLSASTTTARDAVLSYGFQLPVALAATYRFDNISIGPALPAMQGGSVTVPVIDAPTGTVVTVDYGYQGDANSAIAQNTSGVANFVGSSRVNSGGTLTSLSQSLGVPVYPDFCHHLKVTGPATTTAGVPVQLTIIGYDQFENGCDSGPNDLNGEFSFIMLGTADAPNGTHPTLSGQVTTGEAWLVVFSHGVAASGSLIYTPYRAGMEHVDAYIYGADVGSQWNSANGLDLLVNAEEPDALEFTVQPENALAGDILSPAPEVLMVDGYLNQVSLANVPVTIALEDAPEGASLTGTLTVTTTAEGIASFTDLAITGYGGSVNLVASASGMDSAVSNSFTINLLTDETMFIDSEVRGNVGEEVFTISKTFTATGTHRYLFYSFMATGDVDTVTWNGTTMTQLDVSDPFNTRKIHLYGLADPDVGESHDAVITMASGGLARDGAILLYAHVSSTNPISVGDFFTSISEEQSGSATTLTDNSLLMLAATHGADEDFDPLDDAMIRASEHGVVTGGYAVYERGPFATPGTYSIGADLMPDYAFRVYAINRDSSEE